MPQIRVLAEGETPSAIGVYHAQGPEVLNIQANPHEVEAAINALGDTSNLQKRVVNDLITSYLIAQAFRG